MTHADAVAVCLAGRRAMLAEVGDIQATLARLAATDTGAALDALRDRVAVVRTELLAEIQHLAARSPHRISIEAGLAFIATVLDRLVADGLLESERHLRQQVGRFTEAQIAAWLDAQRVQSAAWWCATFAELGTRLIAAATEPW